MPPKKTLYEILGVPPEASSTEVTLAYRARSEALEREPHADAGARALLNEAHEVLSHPTQRAAYDATLAAAPAPGEAAPAPRKPRGSWVPLGVAAAIALVALWLAMKPRAPVSAPAPAAEAPVAAKPAPPVARSAVEILADAVTSGGRVYGHEMSGRSTPLGLAMSVDMGTMVTTCHILPAGAKLSVRVGNDSYPADLVLADEELDLCKLALVNFGTRPLAVSPEAPKAGDRIYTVGVNASGEFALTEGTVRELRPLGHGKVLDLSMPINPESSGGGVFDALGRLVGFTTTRHTLGAAAHVALPVEWVAAMKSRNARP